MPSGTPYTEDQLRKAAADAICMADVIRHFGIRHTGGSYTNFRRRFAAMGIDTSHFVGRRANQATRPRPHTVPAVDLLVLGEPFSPAVKSSRLRRALAEIGRAEECECGQGPVWRGKFLRLQVDHRNGKVWDNRPENLRYMCPNCHAQTETFGSLNKSL